MTDADIVCPACLTHGQPRLWDGVCYKCRFDLTMDTPTEKEAR